MALTQETILTFLLERDGKVKNSEMLSKFKGPLNCSDLAEKKQNRELFKRFVNNVAVVKEVEGEKYIVIKKRYSHLLKENLALTDQTSDLAEGCVDSPGPISENSEGGGGETSDLGSSNVSSLSDINDDSFNRNKSPSPVELALQRCRGADNLKTEAQSICALRSSDVPQTKTFNDKDTSPSVSQVRSDDKTTAPSVQKPCMLPLRLPPPPPPQINIEVPVDIKDKPPGKVSEEHEVDKSPRTKRRVFEQLQTPNSPFPRRAFKNSKPTEEPKFSTTVPLESTEHEWLVKSAAGHWSQVYGLLLQDARLAPRKDFMSGFTALHWAAKCGNSEMVRNIIQLSRQGHAELDVDARSHGGYTALHIAAIHGHERVIALLVRDHGANKNIRDNNGKKPYHYLHKGVSLETRELLGEPQALHPELPHERDGDDHVTELSKGFNTIGRLFQPHVLGPKKKHKQRPGVLSLSEEPEEEESAPRSRSFSDRFKHGALTPQ
ncbi:ankyrin repeat domain-containing protein SOWAHA-like [Megalops cyprinoides]|uniref:ankyrin repeat domain-containing protein SOWAHA-like n=1 Tax=Megalops cyprinoides TaxID=118141 RepID=UPI001864D028|nr:ankyrin repeat domain-containing protein SOWAHA-like [Megalops cyprinoides]